MNDDPEEPSPPLSLTPHALGRREALSTARRLAHHFEDPLVSAGYRGPVAIAGGYVRDIALARTPKDLDIFLDGGHVKGRDAASMLGQLVASQIKGATVHNVIPCYGEWATDIDMVVKIGLSMDHQELAWLDRCPIPGSVELIILRRAAMQAQGFTPRLVNDHENQENFLKACLGRVDLRANAIGACPLAEYAHPEWDFDAYHNRLVVQWARLKDPDADLSRITKRFIRLKREKFPDWTVLYEGHTSDLLYAEPPTSQDHGGLLGYGSQRPLGGGY